MKLLQPKFTLQISFTYMTTIITAYHFNKVNIEAYERLLKSIQNSLDELNGNGHLILVANGTSHNCQSPSVVINDINSDKRDTIIPVAIKDNVGNDEALIKIAASQLLVADLYYDPSRIITRNSKYQIHFDEIIKLANCLRSKTYSPIYNNPPKVSSELDKPRAKTQT